MQLTFCLPPAVPLPARGSPAAGTGPGPEPGHQAPPPSRRDASLGARLGRFVIRRYRTCFAIVLAVMACNVFLRLATTQIDNSDEARYGVSAFEMLQSRSFLVTTYGREKEYWNLKPPLGYWLMALSYSLFGRSALAMRLPSALFALAAVAAAMCFCKRACGRLLSILAGLILATTFGFLSHHGARSGDLDACLTFILLLMAMQLPRLGESPLRVLALGPILACGFLLKSFAILPMIAVGVAYGVATGSWRKLRPGPSLLALATLLLTVAAWAAARAHADGSAYFLERMVREDLVGRSTSVIDHGTSSPLGYVAALTDRFAPWPPLIVVAAFFVVRDRRRQPPGGRAPRSLRWFRRREVLLLVALWIAIPFTLFTLVRTQHHWYLDPIYPACAMLAAPAILSLVRRAPRRLSAAALVVLVALPIALCEARLLKRILVRDRMPASQRFLCSLRGGPRLPCRHIHAAFALSHSERFILEVVDGFRIVEERSTLLPGTGPAWRTAAGRRPRLPAGSCVLALKPAGAGKVAQLYPGLALRESANYVLSTAAPGTPSAATPPGS
ncbi:MAG TPA: glycosyltransferase family 39 protein [Thermoanaerobaculia bacterium]|jgi:4-amino-4-deoxy-L-arabinose transferase-like glycosyltransferase|nr:glycosyltransferase family 39 protein [Thermoanaerobaculia bacterium]